MLTSSSASQFIHPDYLQPLPTTLDAKKSPLALLAQTCSSIGKDTSAPSKPIIPPLQKDTTEKNSEKSNVDKSKLTDSKEKDNDNSDKPGFRTVSHKDIPPLVSTIKSKEDKPSSPLSLKTLPRSKDVSSTSSSATSTHGDHLNSRSSLTKSPGRHSSPHSDDEKRRISSASPRYESRISRDPDEHKSSSYPSYSGYPSLTSSFLSYSHASGLPTESGLHGYPMPLPAHSNMFGSSSAAAVALAAQSAAYAAQSSAAMKSAAMASSLSPFVTYARVRTPSGATTLVPVCRDPYCTHCQLTVQNSHLSATCTAVGCAQCAHEKSLHNLSLGLQSSSLNPYSSSSLLAGQSSLGAYPFSSLYPGHLGHSGLPLVCNWVSSGNEPCGKRFSTSEELLQHLRTHTTSSDPLSIAAAYERYGLPPPGLLPFSGLHGPSLPSGSLSPNSLSSLRRSYPTSLSPLSSLMGSSRYHPYKSLLNPSSALPSNQGLPQVGPYLSPYSLYGQRIGAAAVP